MPKQPVPQSPANFCKKRSCVAVKLDEKSYILMRHECGEEAAEMGYIYALVKSAKPVMTTETMRFSVSGMECRERMVCMWINDQIQ